ncbi:MAG: hypothetical protein IJ005_07445, partial [Bacteroidales bacterium]|nr:hypothetical protein [Bacteroidales bacterium]
MRRFAFSMVLLAGLFAGRNQILAQTDATMSAVSESSGVTPLQQFDFGILNPYADTSKIRNLPIASSEEIRQGDAGNIVSDYAVMVASEDDDSYAFGHIPYQEDITPHGGRAYSIPITVSPMSKFAPQISLQYNSQSGNGLAGYGWDIGGLSSITITNKNLYYNNEVSPADIADPEAVYMLDGVPLVPNDDPALATEYPLETARGHILVKKHLMSGNAVCYFTVLFPDGSEAVFGTPKNTSPKAVYPITRWEDRSGNLIIYSYNMYSPSSAPYYNINSIRYKHKDNDADIGRIDFRYSAREEQHVRYRAGQKYYQKQILKTITSLSQDSTLCTYTLTHELKDGANLLKSIGCSNSSGEQLRPLTFAYGIDQHYEVPPPKDLVKIDSVFLASNYNGSEDMDLIFNRGKMLSDNFKDGLVILPEYSNYGRIDSDYGFLTASFKYGSTYLPGQDIIIAPNLELYAPVLSIKAESGFQCIYPVDVDGNGVDEVVKVNFYGTNTDTSNTILKISIYKVSTSGVTRIKSYLREVPGIYNDNDVFISPVQRCYMFGDFKGDGKIRLLTISFSSNSYYTTNESYVSLIDLESGTKISEQSLFLLTADDYADGKVICTDMDGDGKSELCRLSGSNLNIYNLGGNGFTLTRTITDVTNLLSKGSHITDINGDGYVDIAQEPVETSQYWKISSYTGHGFEHQLVNLNGKTDDDAFQFLDLNKDGLADLIQRNGNRMYLYLNENGTFKYSNRITSSLTFPASTKIIACNATGREKMSDIITMGDTYLHTYGFNQNLAQDRLLTMFTNSLGAVTRNGYEDMASSSAYKTDPSREYARSEGYAKSRFPLYLLRDSQNYLSSAQDGDSMLSNLTYEYYDACVHRRGLGFCGFGKVRMTSFGEPEDKEFVTIETRSPELMGATIKLVRGHMQTMNDPYDITEYTYDTLYTTYGKLNPRLSGTVHTDTLTSIKTITSYSYDSYDYPTSIVVRRSLETEEWFKWFKESEEIEYQHLTGADNYCLGNILSRTSTKSSPVRSLHTFPYNPPDIGLPELPESGLPKPGFNPGTTTPETITLSQSWIEKQVYTYDAQMHPLTRIDSVGRSSSALNKKQETRWTYDTYGNVLTEVSAPYNATEFIGKTFTYDDTGSILCTLTDELGHTTTFSEYNKYGKPLTVTDYAGRVTADVYDDWGTLVSRTTPDGTVSSTASGWSSIGRYYIRKTVTGKPTEMRHYDAAGREVRKIVILFNGQFTITDKVYDRN